MLKLLGGRRSESENSILLSRVVFVAGGFNFFTLAVEQLQHLHTT